MKSIIVLAVVALMSSSAFAKKDASYCTDPFLVKRGFEIHSPEQFKYKKEDVMAWFEKNQDKFELEMTSKIWSFISKTWVEVLSYDNVDSPSMEMLGDLFIVRDLDSKEIVEVRWYKNSKKHVVYDNYYQHCATDLVPVPENALY